MQERLRTIALRLLDAGADPNARTKSWNDEVDVQYFAIGTGDRPLVALLFDRGADPTADLPSAVWRQAYALADLALARGARPDAAVHDGRPLLNELVRWGQVAPALWLLDRGASPNVADARGWTAVHQAASRGNVRLLTALLEQGGDPSRRDATGHTPLDVAEMMERAKLVRLLGAVSTRKRRANARPPKPPRR